MLDPVLNIAIYIIWWWIALFAVLPVGVKRVTERDVAEGHDAGAPQAPGLWQKALWASIAAAVLWAITATVIFYDPFEIRP